MNNNNQVAPGWARGTDDAGRAVYHQVATAEPGYALSRPVDVQRITQDAIGANAAMVNQMLRQFAPTIDAPGNRHPQVTGISSPDELSARNQRFRWTTVEVVILVAITAAGIVLIVQRAMELDTVATIAGWLVLSGFGGVASATWVSHQESQLTPEAIEMERTRGEFDIATQDGETKRILIEAYADAVRDDAAARRASAEAQRAANMAYLERSKPVQRPQRAPVQAYDDSCQDDYEQPQQAPFAPSVATWDDGETEEFQAIAPAQPDRALVAMLAEIDRIYADCNERNSDTITSRLPWSTRGDWSVRDKERAQAVLDTFDPALIVKGEGGRYRLNRAWRKHDAELEIIKAWR